MFPLVVVVVVVVVWVSLLSSFRSGEDWRATGA